MKAVYNTDTGKKHVINEDVVLVDMERGIFVLADGMGGCKGGEVASDMAAQTAYAWVRERKAGAQDTNELAAIVADAFDHAHCAVREKSFCDPTLKGMGTTLLIMAIQGHEAIIGHVGDSRAYLVRDGITALTADHSLENHHADNIMFRELFFLKRARVLSQAVGASREIAGETVQLKLNAEDIVLLCSDGLTDMISEKLIGEIVMLFRDDLQAAVDALVEAANRMGGKDNISVILVQRAE